ncbi:hypothetical protein FEE95_00150 [Maribacter algarum]|uniref:Ig-like domain-containing protein n=1 Tax=Maribacter algarum (ex Zhang et al. 2020) TaxID=2578118 RepID=A0A5S3PSB0_9FLAO|nr:gliding motility-associated C-terminal domain-containing protein [Maribacter algarum]TMM57879.1 hypothetical protein FEE95_00150 [Maribacter algarum]
MNKKLLPFLLVLFVTSIAAQTTPILDPNFEQQLIDLGIDTNAVPDNSILDADAAAIATLTIARTDITDFTGLEAFVNLVDLDLGNNNFTTAPLSTLTLLENFSFNNNDALASLDITQNTSLRNVNISSSGVGTPPLNTLDLSQNTLLESVSIDGYSELSNLNLPTSTTLHTFFIDQHKLPSIFNLGTLTGLQNLTIRNNQLAGAFEVDLTANTNLQTLDLTFNNMSTIDITNNAALADLNLGDNVLTALNTTNATALISLNAQNNQLTSLDLPITTTLTTVNAQNNQLANLDISNSTELHNLILNRNELTDASVLNQFHAMWSDSLAVPSKQLSTGILDVSDNQISGNLPNLFDVILKPKNPGDPSSFNVDVMIHNNELKFEDFENWHENFVNLTNALAAPGTPIVRTYTYAPQAKVGPIETINRNAGESVTIAVDTIGTSLHYKWFKDGVELVNAPDHSELTINNLKDCDSGDYHVEITSEFFAFENANPPGTGNKNLVIERNDVTLAINTTKECVSLLAPLNGNTNIPVNTGIEWGRAIGACGYKISVGTSSGASDIVNSLDVGFTHVYNFASDLPANSDIHVTITPYFDDGDFTSCTEESFTTGTTSVVPSCTTLIESLGGEIEIPVDTNLMWVEANGADGYRITVGTTSGGNDVVDNLDVGNVTSYDFPIDFALATTVFATIVPYNSIGDAVGCVAESFVIENNNTAITPACTSIFLPSDGATNIPITTGIRWNSIANATGYFLSVGTATEGTDIVSYLDVGNVSSYDFPSNLPEASDIYVSVIAYNEQGTSIDNTDLMNIGPCAEQMFSTEVLTTLPSCATLISPANNAIDVSVEADLIWNAPAGAQGYRLSVGTSSGGFEVVNNEDVGNVTTYSYSNYWPDDRPIYVRITAYNSMGDAIGCMEESFTTEALPEVPSCTTFINPIDNATNVPVNIDLEWNPAPTATGYKLSVGTTSEGTNILDTLDVGNVTIYDLPTDLPQGTVIFAKVVPYNPTGEAPICERIRFTTEGLASVPPCTTLTSPVQSATDVPLTTNIEWAQAPTAAGYRISIGTVSGTSDIIDNLDVGNTTVFDPGSDLPENSPIFVTITPYNSLGDAITCTEEFFTTLAVNPDLECASLFAPAQGAINVDVATDLTWNASLNADGYRVSVGTTSGGTDILNNQDLSILTSYDLPEDLPFNSEIFVNITAYNGEGSSAGCTEFSFTTNQAIAPIPECATLNIPEDGAIEVPLNSAIGWNAVEHAEGYLVSVGTSPGAGDILDSFDAGDNLGLDLAEEFNYGSTIYVSITPYNAQGNASGCSEQSFIIAEEVIIDIDETKFGLSLNGDGVNEVWLIDGIEDHPDNTVFIYNSWGNLVFKMEGYDNNGNVFWGEANQLTGIGANKLPADTYFFHIQIPEGETRIDKLTGYLVLKR